VGQISWIREWRYASSKFRVLDRVAATTARDGVPLPADMAACGGSGSKKGVLIAQRYHSLRWDRSV
jgi:hypothetical protein